MTRSSRMFTFISPISS